MTETTTEELAKILDELPGQPLEGGKGRASVIDWDHWTEEMANRSWFKIGEIEKEIQEQVQESHPDKKVYYSQVMGKLQRLAKKTEFDVKKVLHPTEGVYYRVDRV